MSNGKCVGAARRLPPQQVTVLCYAVAPCCTEGLKASFRSGAQLIVFTETFFPAFFCLKIFLYFFTYFLLSFFLPALTFTVYTFEPLRESLSNLCQHAVYSLAIER